MKRIAIRPRPQWQQKVEDIGFGFHTGSLPYWTENAYYEFEPYEIDLLEDATQELWDLCLEAVQRVIDQQLYDRFRIPAAFRPYIERTWNKDAPMVYGRFDLAYKNGDIKLLEFNADTPTSLCEASIVQWFWLQDIAPQKDQFNSIHEKLIETWQYWKDFLHRDTLYFSCISEHLEDFTTTEYLRDCAIQAGFDTRFIWIEDIGWEARQQHFVDLEGNTVKNIFKLYPWEWLIQEEFGKNILLDSHAAYWIEPAWKMILSNKAILPLLWEMFPDHPFLLPAYHEPNRLRQYAKKPVLSREGANISLHADSRILEQSEGDYGKEGYIYQQLFELPCFDGNYPVIGSWVVGAKAAGIGIRESDGLITNDTARFVPHLINV